MRITKYTVQLDENRRNVLVKESSNNYPDILRLDYTYEIVKTMNMMFHASVLAEEHLWMLAMDTNFHLIGVFEISHGTVDESLINPREIFVRLCLCGAVKFVLVHNHPSGSTTPSEADIKVTARINECRKLMAIKLIDHIIIGDGYYSFYENKTILGEEA